MHEGKLIKLLKEGDKPLDGKRDVPISPNTGRAISLGLYERNDREPDFDLKFTPAAAEDQIGFSISHVDLNDEPKYMVLALFHNYSGAACTVTIRRITDASAKG
ncbi:hypothetical protein [Streptomyces prunicolor]|uniref:Uncharacterized protein n=1 Tax=Streptomyces prunicolor TaxID=67348 RepID=A0ABU4FF00_9ACTN|nr:hypothetical protein [Streptomyces prunicolor]MDV7219166.1 hypothetical protein [Streptomyces prunicolor]